MTARLAATDLACRRGERLLLRGLSFALEAGDALRLAGPNGVGKTSLMRILAGLARPFAGTVVRAGTLALVDERLAMDEDRPLAQALRFWERIDGCSDPAVPLQVMEVAALAEVPVRYLSTGQRKRLAVTRLLIAPRDIWLLDEPLNGLDEAARAKVEALIALHCGGGGICVVASHQPIALPEARTLALADFAP